jgi:hypothetical protein
LLIRISETAGLEGCVQTNYQLKNSNERERSTFCLEEIIKWPICKKRIFDLEWYEKFAVSIKCPHCKNIVKIERRINAKAV